MLAALLIAVAGVAGARSSDRSQPMDIKADSNSCGLGGNASCTFTGNVTITQGTLDIVAAKAVVTQIGGDPNRVQLSGGVTLKQQLDDGTGIDANSASVDYNLKTEVVVFTGNVMINRDRGTMKGQRVVYNMKTRQVDSGGDGNGRVEVRFLPKAAQAQPAAKKASD